MLATRRMIAQLIPLAALLLLHRVAQTQEFPHEKSLPEWTQEEALAVLNDSPWAQQVRVWQLSGRLLGRLPDGRTVVYQDAPNLPPRQYSVPVSSIRPERVEAVYAVRWSSARIVQQALERLRELAPVLHEMQAPPPELSADQYVLTARLVQPPTASAADRFAFATVYDEAGRPVRDEPPQVADVFVGLSDEELRDRAQLRIGNNANVKPERALRHGVGTSEGISFFFPRQRNGRPTLTPNTQWVEFSFQGKKGDRLKVRFKLAEMQIAGRPDY